MPRKLLASLALTAVVLGVALYFLFRDGGEPLPGGPSAGPAPGDVAASKAAPALPGEKAAPAGKKGAAGEEEPAEAKAAPAEDMRPISLFGRVLDGDGKGIPGARLLALHSASWRKTMESVQAFVGGNDRIFELADHLTGLVEQERERVPRAESGGDGSYAFRDLVAGEHRVLAIHAEFLPKPDSWATVKEGEPTRLDIVLIAAYAIAGKVIDGSGKPVAGASIAADPSRAGTERGIVKIIQAMSDVSEGRLLLDVGKAESGEDGSFRVSGLEPIPCDLTVRKEGFIEGRAWKVPAPSDNVVLILEPGSAVAGRIVGPDGSPVAAAEVTLAPEKDAGRGRNLMAIMLGEDADLFANRGRRASSGDDGRFRIAGLRPETYILAVDAEGFAPLERSVPVSGEVASLGDIVLARGRTISGIVIASDGATVAGARVWVPAPAKGGMVGIPGLGGDTRAASETKSDEGGRFVLERLAEGRFEVKASAEGRGEGSATDIEAGARGIEIRFSPGAMVAGIVRADDDSAPIAGAKINSSAGERAETDAEGKFALGLSPSSNPMVQQGQVFIMARHTEFEANGEMRPIPKPGDPPLEIRLRRAVRIAGRVLDAEGHPVESARVRISVPGLPEALFNFMPDSEGLQQVSGADGSFALRVPGPQSGPWKQGLDLTATHPALGVGRAGPIPFPGEGQGWPEVVIQLSQGSTIEGTVTDPAGSPVRGARIRASISIPPNADREVQMISSMLPDSSGKTAYSGADGRYRIEGLWEGRYDIQAHARGFAPKKIEGIEVGRGTIPLDIALDAGARIEGRVVDGAGAPLAGIEVIAYLEPERPAEADRGEAMMLQRMRQMGLGGTGTCRSGADGRFAIAELAGGTFTIMARAKGYGSVEKTPVRPGDPAFDLVLVRLGAIRGIVVDRSTGRPVSSFEVQVISDRTHEEGFSFDLSMVPRHFDDAEGRFLFDDLRAGTYILMVSSKGYAAFRDSASVRTGEETAVRPALEPGHRVEGIVRDEVTGNPIEGARLRSLSERTGDDVPRMPFGGMGQVEAVSDASGGFAFEGLGEGKYLCYTEHPSYYKYPSETRFTISANETPRLDIRMKPGGRLQGKIKNLPPFDRQSEGLFVEVARAAAEEKPAAEGPAKEEATPPEAPAATAEPGLERWSRMAQIQEDGAFSVDGVPPGRYRVNVKRFVYFRRPQEDSASVAVAGPETIAELGEIDIRSGESPPVEFSVP